MQLRLPLFPVGTKMISDCLGVYEEDGLVQYIANGLPVYAHSIEDLNAFRYITSNFIEMGLCRKAEIQRCFHVTENFVYRAHKKFVEEGEEAFFGKDKRHGYAHKIVGEKKARIQEKLYKGQSVNSIAKEEGIRESAIRYHLGKGRLKKKKPFHHNQKKGVH